MGKSAVALELAEALGGEDRLQAVSARIAAAVTMNGVRRMAAPLFGIILRAAAGAAWLVLAGRDAKGDHVLGRQGQARVRHRPM